jgi:cbb3-type cytochrome oxidase subunit 1
VAAVLALVPLLATILNYGRTVSGKCAAVWSDPALRFVALGFVSFVVAALMFTALALPRIAGVLQFTWFVPAQHHLAIFGFFVMAATGGAYYLLPRVTGLPLCARCVAVHFWVALLGILLTVIPLAVGGIVQGWKLNQPTLPFMDTVSATLMVLRVSTLGEVLVLFANFIFLRNIVGVLLQLGRMQLTASWAAATAPAPTPEAAQ